MEKNRGQTLVVYSKRRFSKFPMEDCFVCGLQLVNVAFSPGWMQFDLFLRSVCSSIYFPKLFEVIRDQEPCQLYFDIEYPTKLNQGHDGDRAIEIFKKYVLRKLHDMDQFQKFDTKDVVPSIKFSTSKQVLSQ